MEEEKTFDEPKDKLILVVDDDESILDLLEHVIKKEGFRVERAGDGDEALRKVEALRPDLIILDFMLPVKGGFEVLKELQQGEAGSTPVLVITGRRIDPQTIDLIKLERNVREYIEKPIKPAGLMIQIHRVLGTRPPESRRALGPDSAAL